MIKGIEDSHDDPDRGHNEEDDKSRSGKFNRDLSNAFEEAGDIIARDAGRRAGHQRRG